MKRIIALSLMLLLLLFGSCALAEYKELLNPNLDIWCNNYNSFFLSMFAEGGDYSGDSILMGGKIIYDPTQTRVSYYGDAVADGGLSSTKGTYMVGMGAGVENEDLWYISFTFGANASGDDIVQHSMCAMLACLPLGLNLGDGESAVDNLTALLMPLLTSEKDIAIKYCDLVFVKKDLGGKLLFSIDSNDFYDGFYAGTISNFLDLDE